MIKVHLLFTEMHHNLKTGEKFDEVEFEGVQHVNRSQGGACTIRFEDGSEYSYPWHTLKRVRVTETFDTVK